jgi:rhamnulokinase
MPKTTIAAIDLGATSGRVIVGQVGAKGIELTETHRFPNAFTTIGTHNYWDVGRLYGEIMTGLKESPATFITC